MAAYEVLTINTNIPQIQAPQSGDTYSFPRVAEFIAGTAAAPALTTTGDTDTGVFFPAANTWAVATGASERMRISSGGDVGIGTTSPGGKTEIKSVSSGAVTTALVLSNDVASSVNTGTDLRFYVNTGREERYAAIRSVQATSGNFADLRFLTSNSDTPVVRMTITPAGDVGVGTASPAAKLHVSGQIRTEAPTGGTAANWRLGTVHTVSPTSPNRTIEVDIGGTIYYLHAKTTND